ncbi:toxic anion resistance protein, partial [Staphylococcus epidermidis]|uniref:toxic anion resistance protein n=1 Tax=Staphylococcus epidermidis TaxID=1282 RepID=UPI0037D99ABA
MFTETIPHLPQNPHQTPNQIHIQPTPHIQHFLHPLHKPIYHLQLSTQIPIQTPPQIPIIQNLNQPLPQKIQTSI